jgi:hypothetical protein
MLAESADHGPFVWDTSACGRSQIVKYDLHAAVKHVVHDYTYLVVAGTDTQNHLPHPFNHYAERTFLVHCRAMAKFFENGRDARDMYARDFLQTPITRNLATWDHWHDHVDKHLAHLTIGRLDKNVVPWMGTQNKDFLREFRAMWEEFYKNLEPSLKPTFDAEIAAMQKQFPKVPLT